VLLSARASGRDGRAQLLWYESLFSNGFFPICFGTPGWRLLVAKKKGSPPPFHPLILKKFYSLSLSTGPFRALVLPLTLRLFSGLKFARRQWPLRERYSNRAQAASFFQIAGQFVRDLFLSFLRSFYGPSFTKSSIPSSAGRDRPPEIPPVLMFTLFFPESRVRETPFRIPVLFSVVPPSLFSLRCSETMPHFSRGAPRSVRGFCHFR